MKIKPSKNVRLKTPRFMIIGYARVSTLEQNLDLQIDALNQAGCEKIFVDRATGANMNRPALQEALEFMRTGDRLIIWKMDRLGRSMLDCLKFLDELKQAGTNLTSLTEHCGTGTASEQLLMALLMSFAQHERNLIVERTRAGLEAARARGRYGGRPKKLTPQQEKGLAAMAANPAISISEIAEAFNISRPSVYAYLKRLSKAMPAPVPVN